MYNVRELLIFFSKPSVLCFMFILVLAWLSYQHYLSHITSK